MAINIIDPNAPGQRHVDSYWAATAGNGISSPRRVYQRAMYMMLELQDRR